MDENGNTPKSFGAKLQALNSRVLYLVLFIAVSASLIISNYKKVSVPIVPQEYTKDAYKLLRNIPEGKTIIIDTAYTPSGRGENGGEIEAVVRMCMRQNVKFVLYTWTEPQCVEVAKNLIRQINDERTAKNQRIYEEWNDYVILGFFPDGATMLQTVSTNLREAWSAQKAKDPTGIERQVFQSPVLQNINRVEDFSAYVSVAASGVMPTIVARVGKKVPVISMITGVMFPEQFNYYKSGQLKGLVNGLVGVAELEELMEKGIDAKDEVGGKAEGTPIAAPYVGETNYARGMDYYPAFCVSMSLLILAIVVGNIGMFLERRRNN